MCSSDLPFFPTRDRANRLPEEEEAEADDYSTSSQGVPHEEPPLGSTKVEELGKISLPFGMTLISLGYIDFSTR